MWPAFPTSDYHESSVTMGLAPRRPSHVLTRTTFERAVSAPFDFSDIHHCYTDGAYLIF
jgi:hypothetical protein